jgi:hypothetical protein
MQNQEDDGIQSREADDGGDNLFASHSKVVTESPKDLANQT